MAALRDEFLSEDDLTPRHMSEGELMGWWETWLPQAQTTHDVDRQTYSHGVFTVGQGAEDTGTRGC